MGNKQASEKFGVPRNTISTWLGKKKNFSLHYKKLYCLLKKFVAVITKK